MLIYIYMKCREDSWHGFQVIVLTRFCDKVPWGVMTLALCISSKVDLYLYEVLKIT